MKTYKIPVTWLCYGTVEVEAEDIKDAIKKFNEIENSDKPFALPIDSDYVDGSFELSCDNDEDLVATIKLMNDEK